LHLSHLGLAAGETIEVVTKTKNSAIIIVKGSRLAFDASILDKIDLAPAEEDQKKIPLSELPVGHSAIVTDIFSANETKRRLMDMGITKRTRVLLRKVAPLGDPLEISLRGYELTLRKSEAQMISVVMLDEEEEK
ncbi:MAG: FeoA family protein, partial [Streptococcus thermophilus]